MNPQNAATLLKIVAWGFIGFAVVLGLAPYGPISEPSRLLVDLLDWPFGDAAPTINRTQMWLSSVSSGLIIALAIMLLGIVVPALANSNKPVIRTSIWAFVIWFLVDAIGSVASGVTSNAIFNGIFLVFLLIPMLMVRYENNDS